MSDISSLEPVPKENARRYNEDYADNARAALKRFVATFESQQEAADALGFDQGTVSRSTNLANQPTLKVLIALRDRTGQSIDEILGLPPAKGARVANADEVGRLIAHLTKMIPNAPAANATASPAVGATRDVDAEVRPSELPPPTRAKKKKRP